MMMKRAWKFTGGAGAFAAVLALPFLVSDPAPNPTKPDVSALFDPQQIAANICGPDRPGNPYAGTRRVMARFTGAAQAAHHATGAGLPHLFDAVGSNHMAVTTDKPLAQRYFDQGLRFTYGFNHPQAILAFRAAQSLDPTCALCFWGEALSWGPNINAGMEEWGNILALGALAKAQALAGNASAKEQALIAALSTRYSPDLHAERAVLNQAFADAMGRVSADYPDDLNIAVMHGESLMDTQPWDYWEADLTTPKPATAQTLATLHRVLKADPAHMGAIHLYIHITEASTNARWAEPYADTLGALAPQSGHLVHMPSHTYYRVGRFIDSLNANVAAAIADENLIAAVGAAPDWDNYGGSYYPHNVHFLMTSAHMAGDAANTLAAAAKLDGMIPEEVLVNVPWTTPIKAAPYFAHLHYSDSATLLALPAPPERQPYVLAAWHFARGTVLAKAGDIAAAQAEMVAIAVLRENANWSFLENRGVPAGKVIAIEETMLKGQIARAQGYQDIAIALFTEAMQMEIALPYTEPPYWYYPIRQTLGAALMQAGRHDEAAAMFTTSLLRVPNNGWALYGLSLAQSALGDDAGAAATEKLLSNAWVGDRGLLTLDNL